MNHQDRPFDGEPQSLLPLSGVHVLDFTANMSGPFATMILGDQGADVIKVEPLTGDVLRTVGTASGGMSAYFANLNRSKRSLVLGLAEPGAQPVIQRLLDWADVVVANFRPGVAATFGIDAASVAPSRPSLIYVEISGFGHAGPYAGWPAYDHVIQALSGFVGIQADPSTGARSLVLHGVVDKATGQMAAQAITAALLRRTRTGKGGVIEVSMLDVAISFLWPDGMMNNTIIQPETTLQPISRTFRLTTTRDGQLAFIIVTRQQWTRLLEAVGIPDDPGLDTPGGRARLAGGYLRQVSARLGAMTTAEAVEALSAKAIPVAPVLGLDEVHQHPQVVASRSIEEFEHPVLGRIRQANPPVRFDDENAARLRPAPALGQHTREILAELGLDADRLGSARSEAGVTQGS